MVIVSTPHSTTRRYEVPARQYAVVAHGGEFAPDARHAVPMTAANTNGIWMLDCDKSLTLAVLHARHLKYHCPI
jgi:hypothetical protein